jgi:hypothetical protein
VKAAMSPLLLDPKLQACGGKACIACSGQRVASDTRGAHGSLISGIAHFSQSDPVKATHPDLANFERCTFQLRSRAPAAFLLRPCSASVLYIEYFVRTLSGASS